MHSRKINCVSTRGYEDFLLDYPGVNERMTAGNTLEELLIQLDGSQRLTMTNPQERENYSNALNNGELLLYIDDESELDTPEGEETMELREERLAVNKEKSKQE